MPTIWGKKPYKIRAPFCSVWPPINPPITFGSIKHLSYQESTGLSYNTLFKYIQKALLHCQRYLEDE
ncbi:hypothetical protein [Methylomicrobium lacus]|uniref:hypothetical protein n=1 Tax=Methylomicrobium lacus TaxID=136992 RepID=UPI00045E75DB|nr:hypothetical protein [Methylomicrobium lacus]